MSDIEPTTHLPVESQWRYKTSRRIFWPYLKARGVDVHNLENLPGHNTAYVLAIKHHSILDVPVAGNILYEHDGTQVHFVTKRELIDFPFLGHWLRKAGGIRFDRDKLMSEQPEVLEEMTQVVTKNGVLGNFTEQSRTPGPHLLIQQKGLGIFAVANGIPIATLGLYGTDKHWGRIQAVFGETFYPSESDDPSDRRRLMVAAEREYTASLQQATFDAYSYAGVDYNNFPLPVPRTKI